MSLVLIVDDKDENLYLLRALMGGHGWTVEEARHGAEALAKARQSPPDIIISDLLMPVMDGYTLLRHWKADEQLREIPFVVYTATYTEPRDEKLALDLGADAFLLKPSEPEPFLARIQEVLGKHHYGDLADTRHAIVEEQVLLKEYSETLVRKLESKAVQLEQANRQLQAEIIERRRAEEAVCLLNEELEQRVRERTAELEAANQEISAFSFSVSHDLRAPLRSIDGFSKLIEDQCGAQLNEAGRSHFARVRAAARAMGGLIDDLMKLAKITRVEMRRSPVDMTALAREIADGLQRLEPERHVNCEIADGLCIEGDPQLIRLALENLLGNAWKFTGKRAVARIEFGRWKGACSSAGAEIDPGTPVYFVRDNGAGFDMAYAKKLFGAFQRLHTETEFEGTGIGLATVQRILNRHGGRIWAEAEVEKGATFYFAVQPSPTAPLPLAS